MKTDRQCIPPVVFFLCSVLFCCILTLCPILLLHPVCHFLLDAQSEYGTSIIGSVGQRCVAEGFLKIDKVEHRLIAHAVGICVVLIAVHSPVGLETSAVVGKFAVTHQFNAVCTVTLLKDTEEGMCRYVRWCDVL